MATKQHVSLDVLAGAVLGAVFAWTSRWCDRKLQPLRQTKCPHPHPRPPPEGEGTGADADSARQMHERHQ
jgi:hypothetical protein